MSGSSRRPEPAPTFAVDPEIRRARTPAGDLYTSEAAFALQRDRVLRPAWHLTPALPGDRAGEARPFELLPQVLRAPLVLVRGDDGRTRCLSNVCTHRANLVVDAPGCLRSLRCRYHGRRFSLDGRFTSMPEFETAEDFPSEADHLPELPLESLGPITFTSLAPAVPFERLAGPVRARTAFLPWDRLVEGGAKTYEVAAHWALYVENYLEGFHVPFVHPSLAQELEYASYGTELFEAANVQIGVGKRDDATFDLPAGHPDHGQRVAGYYFWLFPTTMVNVYPWGVSLNAVEPLDPSRTRVHFVTWVWDEARRGVGAGADLDAVELEDEAVVQAVQRGVRSPLYRGGRYSPARERGVHHFHRLLCAAMSGGGAP